MRTFIEANTEAVKTAKENHQEAKSHRTNLWRVLLKSKKEHLLKD